MQNIFKIPENFRFSLKMRIIIFALAFAVLIALTSFAEGLEITKIDVRADYDYSMAYRLEQEEKLTRVNYAAIPLKNGSRVNADVFPGANLTFTVTIENTFKDSTQALRDIIAKITIEGRHGKKYRELSGGFDLEPGTVAKADVKIMVPFDADSGLHGVFIDVQGTGKNHTLYQTVLNLGLDISKLSHDIRITKVLLEPNAVDCKRKAELSAEIANSGSNTENGVALEFRSPSLGINSYEKNLTLASSTDNMDDQMTHKKTINIEVPSFLKSGTYPIYINLYWQNFILFDQKTVYLTVGDCAPTAKSKPAQEAKNETLVPVIKPAGGTGNITSGELITATEEVSILDSPVLLSMLLGVVFLLMILAVLVVFGLLKKPGHGKI